MDSVNKLIKSIRGLTKMSSDVCMDYCAYGIFGAAVLYIFYNGQLATIGLAAGVAMILYVATGKNLNVSLIAGALAGLIAVHYSRSKREGFASPTSDLDEEPFKNQEENGEDVEEAEVKPKKAKGGKKPAPDHGDRAEMFELGKKYKMPSEDEDEDIHLDAGTTFMNAYKSLKPDQIAAMTKDTQELMQTQRQLMSTLSTLKPLIQDGKQMMDMFQGYFGGGAASMA